MTSILGIDAFRIAYKILYTPAHNMSEQLKLDPNQSLRWNFIERAAIISTGGDPTLQDFRDRVLHYPAKVISTLGLSAAHISFLGVFFALTAAVAFPLKWVFCLALTFNLICDGIDGVVARYQEKDSDEGAVLDVFCDTVSLWVVAIGLFCHGVVSPITLFFYCVSTAIYSARSMLKSKVLSGVYRSVGSRVLAFVGLICFATKTQTGGTEINEDAFLIVIIFMLLLTYVVDIVWSRCETISN